MATANVSPIICGNNETSGARGAFRLEIENVNEFLSANSLWMEAIFFNNIHFTIFRSKYSRLRGSLGYLPTGNLSNDTDAVYICKITEVGDDCCCNDLLRADTRTQFRDWAACSCQHWAHDAPCWSIEGQTEWSHDRTYHYKFYWDGQRQLLSVAGVELFDHDENSEGQDADHDLWCFSLR